jgi:hypothetical protein
VFAFLRNDPKVPDNGYGLFFDPFCLFPFNFVDPLLRLFDDPPAFASDEEELFKLVSRFIQLENG